MTATLHSLWLLPAAEDEAMLAALVRDLAGRFGTPVFAPHMTMLGDSTAPRATLEQAIAEAAAASAAFAEPVAAIETGESFFRSFYLRFADSSDFGVLKQALDPQGLADFMPHVSLIYGTVEPAAKAAALAEISTRLAGRPIRFDRLCVVTSAQQVPIEEWRVVATVALS